MGYEVILSIAASLAIVTLTGMCTTLWKRGERITILESKLNTMDERLKKEEEKSTRFHDWMLQQESRKVP